MWLPKMCCSHPKSPHFRAVFCSGTQIKFTCGIPWSCTLHHKPQVLLHGLTDIVQYNASRVQDVQCSYGRHVLGQNVRRVGTRMKETFFESAKHRTKSGYSRRYSACSWPSSQTLMKNTLRLFNPWIACNCPMDHPRGAGASNSDKNKSQSHLVWAQFPSLFRVRSSFLPGKERGLIFPGQQLVIGPSCSWVEARIFFSCYTGTCSSCFTTVMVILPASSVPRFTDVIDHIIISRKGQLTFILTPFSAILSTYSADRWLPGTPAALTVRMRLSSERGKPYHTENCWLQEIWRELNLQKNSTRRRSGERAVLMIPVWRQWTKTLACYIPMRGDIQWLKLFPAPSMSRITTRYSTESIQSQLRTKREAALVQS